MGNKERQIFFLMDGKKKGGQKWGGGGGGGRDIKESKMKQYQRKVEQEEKKA